MTTYATRDEAIAREIVAAIEATGPDVARADNYDVDAIAREVLGTDERGRWRVDVDSDEFWRSVEAHATYRVEVAGETVDTGDVAAIARLISREVPDADAPMFAEELGALPGALETEWAVRVGEARLFIGPDGQYSDGVAWAIYRNTADQDAGEAHDYGGWAVSDRDTARREIAVIIDTLERMNMSDIIQLHKMARTLASGSDVAWLRDMLQMSSVDLVNLVKRYEAILTTPESYGWLTIRPTLVNRYKAINQEIGRRCESIIRPNG